MSRSRRKPSRLRSRELTQAMLWPPMACTSCATAMLETVARPMWLSGIRKVLDTAVSTPIWWRACVRSGRTGGSISQMISNGRALMRATLGQEPALGCRIPAIDPRGRHSRHHCPSIPRTGGRMPENRRAAMKTQAQ